MVHPNPFIDDEAEEDPDYVDPSDEREEEEEDEIDYYLYRTEHNSEPIQDSTISSTEYSALSPYVNRSSSPTWNQYSPGRASSASSPLYEPHTPESPPISPSPLPPSPISSEHEPDIPLMTISSDSSEVSSDDDNDDYIPLRPSKKRYRPFE
jgi:hypothetical protein